MPANGRPPKPIEAHRRTGTFKPSRHDRGQVALVEPISLPETADSLPAVFDQVMSMGVSWLGRTDAVALTLLRSLLEERELVHVDAVAGSTEARKALRDLDKQIHSLLSSLGFTPADRTRLGVAEVKTVSKLEELRRKAK